MLKNIKSFLFSSILLLSANVNASTNTDASLDNLKGYSLSELQNKCHNIVEESDKQKCLSYGKSDLRNLLKSYLEKQDKDSENKREAYRITFNEINQSILYDDYKNLCDTLKNNFPNDEFCISIPDCEDSSIGEISKMAKKCLKINVIVSSNCSDWYFYDEIYKNEMTIYLDLRYVKNLYKTLGIAETEDGYDGRFFNDPHGIRMAGTTLSYNKEQDLANLLNGTNFDYNKKLSYIVNKLSQYDETISNRLNEEWIKNCIIEMYNNDEYIKANLK